jgi:hypothetical protein
VSAMKIAGLGEALLRIPARRADLTHLRAQALLKVCGSRWHPDNGWRCVV